MFEPLNAKQLERPTRLNEAADFYFIGPPGISNTPTKRFVDGMKRSPFPSCRTSAVDGVEPDQTPSPARSAITV
jgi:hypothetical protein